MAGSTMDIEDVRMVLNKMFWKAQLVYKLYDLYSRPHILVSLDVAIAAKL